MPRPLPAKHATRPATESKKTARQEDPTDERSNCHATRTALDNLHADLGRVTALAEAADGALSALPYAATPQERRGRRVLDAFVTATRDAAREALAAADSAIDALEGRRLYTDDE